MNNWTAFGNNCEIIPRSKNKVIGDTAKFLLFGDVVSVGDDVKKIKIGDVISYTLFGINEVELEDKSKKYYIQEDSDFVLGIQSK